MYYEILRSDQQSSEAKDKAMEEILNKASEVWLKTNSVLFKHVPDYEAKLDAFLNKTGVGSENKRSTIGQRCLK